VLYAAFKGKRNEQQAQVDEAARKADRELIDTLKISNDLLRAEKRDTHEQLQSALQQIAELRGELRTLRDMPLQQLAKSFEAIASNQATLLANQQVALKHLGIELNNDKEA
ncbi:MAG: hypothetical protein VW395_09840, partial [Methylotenera sp.]